MINYEITGAAANRQLPFYLAMEEWIAMRQTAHTEDSFFVWQVNPTVIFGRNQLIEAEVDIDYCRSHGIEMYRRKSGGGCVFADRSNLMFSYITWSGDDVSTIFGRYSDKIAKMLRSLGFEAEATGRNDITIGGAKVSGGAFYRTPSGASIVHSTMLYDTDMTHMANAITPSRTKLAGHRVQSVESRIGTLSRHTSMSIDEFERRAIEHLSTSRVGLSDTDIAEIERLAAPYYDERWIMNGRRSQGSPRRIESVGEVTPHIEMDSDGAIASAAISGDYFAVDDINPRLSERLLGVRPERAEIAAALDDIDPSLYIPNLDKQQLINLITP